MPYPVRAFFLLVMLMPVMCGFARAQSFALSAPEPLQSLLEKHFILPSAAFQDEIAEAAYMRRAQREISELLSTEGYFTPTITLKPAALNGERILKVTPGSLTRVSVLNIEFSGSLSAERIEKLRAAWRLKTGEAFRSQDWDDAKAALLAQVAEEDYAAAQITASQAEVNPATAEVELTVLIDSGPAFKFGDLLVTGLDRYDRLIVTRQATFKKGEPYRRNRLLAFQTRLQNMPQLASAMVHIDPDTSKFDAIPVQIELTEMQSRKLALGVGGSTNNGPRSEINYLDHNFLDSAWNLSSALRLEQNRQTLSAGIGTLPDDNGYLLTWGLGGETTLIKGLQTELWKLGVTRSRTLGQIETRIGFNWQQEGRRASGGIQENNQALVLDWQWHRRAVDDMLYPRRGSATEIRAGGANRQFMSNRDFLRGYARQQLWWPMGQDRDALSLRGEVGVTAALSRLGIPQEYLFRAGGSQSVRGYAYQSLGVLEGSAIVGGRALATASLEYTHWFSDNWGIAAFTDTGGVSDVLHNMRVSTAYGSGARWRSPVGPLALDLARGKTSLQLHFSLAVAL